VTAGAAATRGTDVRDRITDGQSSVPAAGDDKLQSELLLDLVFDKGPANRVGSPAGDRVVVPVTGGTFEGPRLKGVIAGPGGDWIVVRSDGSSLLDLRLLLQTDDGQKIYMACRGIAYTQPGGALYARILPAFETGSAKYTWLNNVVAVGVYRPMPEKVAYRVYRIL
jgi:hypothetical protein